ncbi:MAG: glycerophosphodiester phosphodiesterase family protein, partial [Elusimicrobia bacterium]|nr:glycerophosphodiester phosphodiesterase family protein [Elusimicrobiota bacterium]
ENTMAAFRLALEQGAEALEFDVHQTADRELVVLHDEDLRRVAGRPEAVRDLTWPELCRFDVGNWFDPRFRGERIPRLDEVFDLAGRRTLLHVELKRGSAVYPGIERALADFIRRRKALRSCVVSSFDHAALFAIRAQEPRLRLGYLLGSVRLDEAWAQIKDLAAESIHFGARQVTAERVRAAHRRGLNVLVYTVNDTVQAVRLARLGVDGVFSDDPPRAGRGLGHG